LENAGLRFYRWPLRSVPDGVLIRLVTSYATVSADADAFIQATREFS